MRIFEGALTAMKKRSAVRRIFVIGQNPAVCRRVADLLAEHGHEVLVHPDRPALIAAVNTNPPDLVIICAADAFDASLGTMLSAELALPFAVLTESRDEAVARAAAASGALACLPSGWADLQYVPILCAALADQAEMRELRLRLEQLSDTLQRSRTISVATGVLMERLRVPRTHAFTTLRTAARAQRIRLADFASSLLTAVESINHLRSDPGDPAGRPDARNCERPHASHRKRH